MECPGRRWSVKHYKDILPKMEHLPESHQRAWMYYGLFPNTVLGFTHIVPFGLDHILFVLGLFLLGAGAARWLWRRSVRSARLPRQPRFSQHAPLIVDYDWTLTI
mgnify:CR=1 FL=1